MAGNRQDTRARLLAAATGLFAERGFHGTTVREIAERAGANVAAANYHFGSKEGLYLGVLRTQFSEVRGRLRESGAIPADEELDALSKEQLAAIVKTRVATMLDFLLGPPPSPHATLMAREMLDPSEALPAIVAEFVSPQVAELGAVLRRLAPKLEREDVESCVFSMIAQVLFYSWTKPVHLLLQGRKEYARGTARVLAEQIGEFSLGGLARLAGRRERRRRGR